MKKILDGTVVQDTSYYQFFVQMKRRAVRLDSDKAYSFWGGGVLIDPFWVLTCAHTFTLDSSSEEKHNYDVCLCLNNDSIYEQAIEAEKFILFPNDSKYIGVDAALVKLKHSGTEVGAKTIDLYELPIEYGQEVRMIGRGHHNPAIGLQFNEKLRYIDTKIAPPDMCTNDISINNFNENDYYCVGEDKVEHITLTGDSGSPLLIRDLITREFKILGIVSGTIPLTEPGPDGNYEISHNYCSYTKVPAILDWIKETIENK